MVMARSHLGWLYGNARTSTISSNKTHRTVKKRVWLAKGYGSFQSAWRTLEGIETVNMIRKGRVRWVAKGDVVAEARFIAKLFAIAAKLFPHLHNSAAPQLRGHQTSQ